MKAAWFLLFTVIAAAQTASHDQTGGVTGTVTDAVTHMPVKKTMVSVNPIGNIAGFNLPPQAAITDASGTFTIANIPAGKYQLMFHHPSYPQTRFAGLSKTVEVKLGETAGPVSVELIPGAAVTGRVLDEDGDPLPNCNVEIHPTKNPERGVALLGISSSNQEGEYRAYGIAPGKYILSARCQRPVFQPRPFSAGPDPPPTRAYPPQYYPLASDAKGAQVVELTGGAEKSGIDFQMTPTAVTQIHGVFSPGGAQWHGNNQLMMQLISPGESSMNRNMSAPSYDLTKGTFEFKQVFPGSYILAVFSNGTEDNRIGAWQRVDVSDRPIEMMLELRHAIDLSGKVEIESGGNTTNKVTLNQIQVMVASQNQNFGMPGSVAQVNEDGTFTLKGVTPAPWRLRTNAPSAFVKSAWLGSADVTNTPMDLSGGAAGALRIVVSTNTATIRGSAPVGQAVNAQPVDVEPNFSWMRGAGVDQNGQYKLDGLPPGKYRLTVSDAGGPSPDDAGQEVTVHEGETVMLDLKAPSAP